MNVRDTAAPLDFLEARFACPGVKVTAENRIIGGALLALTGREHGPEMKNLLPLIGRERARARLSGATA